MTYHQILRWRGMVCFYASSGCRMRPRYVLLAWEDRRALCIGLFYPMRLCTVITGSAGFGLFLLDRAECQLNDSMTGIVENRVLTSIIEQGVVRYGAE